MLLPVHADSDPHFNSQHFLVPFGQLGKRIAIYIRRRGEVLQSAVYRLPALLAQVSS